LRSLHEQGGAAGIYARVSCLWFCDKLPILPFSLVPSAVKIPGFRITDHARSTDHPIFFTPVILTDSQRMSIKMAHLADSV
jgi:hypothetical protein